MEFFEKLMDKYEEIQCIYKELYNLECNGDKKTDLFLKTVELLKKNLHLEKILLNQFVNSEEYEKINYELETYCKKEEMFLRIRDRIILYEMSCMKEFEEDGLIEDEDVLEMKEMIDGTGKIFDIISKNIFLLYAYFLDSTIEKLLVHGLKRKLLGIKYYNCIIKHNLELALSEYNFVFDSDVYTDVNLRVDLMRLDENYVQEVMLDGYITSINSSIEGLMSNNDDSYSNSENMLAVSINYQCLLKAVFALMDERDYRLLEGQIINKIKELGNKDNYGSIENIADIINNRNEYRSKIKKLSLRPLK